MRVDVRLAAAIGFLCLASIKTRPAMAQLTNTARGVLLARTGQQQGDSSRAESAGARNGRRISVDFHDVQLKAALQRVAKDARVAIFYNDRDIPAQMKVSLQMSNALPGDVLRALLGDSGLRVRRIQAGLMIERGSSAADSLWRDSTGTINGVVIDSTSGSPVSGADVTVMGTDVHTRTGQGGEFEIAKLDSGSYTLVTRMLGYSRRTTHVTIASGDTASVTITLAQVPRVLDQVVTTATGDRRRVEVGNVTDVIEGDSLVRAAPIASLSEALATRVPGLQVYFPGGVTGVAPQINIRGQNSLSLMSQPLLYIDGIRVDNSAGGSTPGPVYGGPSSGRFDDLVPSEIESIEVVKGPSAATLYGTDAANGVILVRTKHGAAGPPRWHIFAEGGLLELARGRFRTNYFPWGHQTAGDPDAIRCPLRSVAAGTCAQDSITSFSPILDPETTPFGSGSRYSVGAQVAGGSDVRYFLSGTIDREIGYLKMPDADRALVETQVGHPLDNEALKPNGVRKYSGRLNVTIPLAPTADVTVAVGLNSLRLRVPTPTVLDAADGPGIRDQNDGWRSTSRPGDAFSKRNRQNVTHVTTSIAGNWRPAEWLSARMTAGLDHSSEYDDRLARAGVGFLPFSVTGARENTKIVTSLQSFDGSGSVELPIATRISSRTTVGVQYNRRLALVNTAAAQQLTPGAGTVAGGALQVARETTTETVVAGGYAEQTFGFNERLYVTLAARADGGSAFGKAFQTALYPKGSISWLLSDEKFWPELPILTSLRLRAAYGHSGVQPGPVAALASESLFPAFVSGVATTGAGIGSLGNPDLKPERQEELELGIDLQAFDGKVQLGLTRYDKRSRDALVSLPLPSSLGGGTRWENVGAVRNWGYEASLAISILERPALHWSVSLSGSVNDNKVIEIAPGVDGIYSTVYPSTVRGYPLFAYFDYPITGFDDVDGNAILTEDEISVGNERAFAGRSYPRSQLAGSTEVGLFENHLRFSVSLEHRGGFSLLDHEWIKCSLDACRATSFLDASLRDQAAAQAQRSASLRNTKWGFVRDASFTRLRELSLTYVFGDGLSQKLGLREASAMISARNVALWTRYPGADPEVQTLIGQVGRGAGYDRPGLPAPSYWLLRVNVIP